MKVRKEMSDFIAQIQAILDTREAEKKLKSFTKKNRNVKIKMYKM